MKGAFPGLSNATLPAGLVPEGLYLVQVRKASLRKSGEKPFLQVEFGVIEPLAVYDRIIRTRLYCTPRALWKLQWFLRDFDYGLQSAGKDEINDKDLLQLSGVIKVSYHDVNGRTWVNLDGFAPKSSWVSQVSLSRTSEQPPE
jgi:hypothetical protein